VCDVGRGNLAISKLLALKKFGPFLRSTYYWMSWSRFLGGGAPHHQHHHHRHHREAHPGCVILVAVVVALSLALALLSLL
jgi:hypothetical protein